jgi:2-amino-4-hydroxy-6-hydroxymethyldihydropteridine diphosphokinase
VSEVYLGLGANLGARETQILRAVAELGERTLGVRALSPLYETEPWGLLDQPRFLNAACLVHTDLGPLDLLRLLQEIERALGRVPTVLYGPRAIDLDILLYDDLIVDEPMLSIPHVGMLERSSVLVPLADIAPDVRHPRTGPTTREHLMRLGHTPEVQPYPPLCMATQS